jgi:hypothetical protein
MRRRLLSAALAAPIAAAGLTFYGCSGEQAIESVCRWIADPDNCFHEFREDAVDADGKPLCVMPGSQTEVDQTQATVAAQLGTPNGTFLARDKLDICFVAAGGQVVFDPPLDLAALSSAPSSDAGDAAPAAIVYTMKFMDATGTECGNAQFTSTFSFAITINPPPGAGATTTFDSGAEVVEALFDNCPDGDDLLLTCKPQYTYGTYSQVLTAADRTTIDSTCPSGEAHHFQLAELDTLGESACEALKPFAPQARLTIIPGGVQQDGGVSFAIVYPPVATNGYPDVAKIDDPQDWKIDGATPESVVYFNCTIPGAAKVCANNVKDGGETDVDCGGIETEPGCPARCGDGQQCVTDCDCATGFACVVDAGIKQCKASLTDAAAPDCSSVLICQNGRQDGAETDVDCGGGFCPGCANGQACTADTDCLGGYCLANVCATAACDDGVINQGESDADCGGTSPCPRCDDGSACTADTDCANGFCNAGTCATANCNDGVQNQNETDVDCGGANACPRCANTLSCLENSDCLSNGCVMGQCLVPTCTDATQDGTETDVDCGGPNACPRCADGLKCNANTDCLNNGVCGPSGADSMGNLLNTCFPATCGDNLKNGTESDVDCGGPGCPKCLPDINKTCLVNSDCLFNGCTNGFCTTPTCTDGVTNGTESDQDCGGLICSGCPTGDACLQATDCASMICVNNVCQ